MLSLRLLAIVSLMFLFGCSSMSVKTDFDPSIDFSQYKSYRWYQGKNKSDDALAKNPLIRKRVMASVDAVMAKKGYQQTTTDSPDFVIIVHAGIKQKTQVTSYGGYGYGGYGYGRYGGYGGYGGGWGGGGTDVYQYDEATLIIDIADFGKKELAWRGSGTDVMSDTSDPEEMQANIDDAVATILDEFPSK